MGLGDPRKTCSRIRPAIRIAFCVALALIILTSCSHDSASRIHVELRDAPNSKPVPETEPKDSCPPADPSETHWQSSAWTGHHVTLSWNRSTSSNGANGKNIRYCLYRSDNGPVRRNPASLTPPCVDCQRITDSAVAGTIAFDNHLEIGARYCYVAVAIDISDGKLSTFSNQAAVVIPPATGLPVCDSQINAQQPDTKKHRRQR